MRTTSMCLRYFFYLCLIFFIQAVSKSLQKYERSFVFGNCSCRLWRSYSHFRYNFVADSKRKWVQILPWPSIVETNSMFTYIIINFSFFKFFKDYKCTHTVITVVISVFLVGQCGQLLVCAQSVLLSWDYNNWSAQSVVTQIIQTVYYGSNGHSDLFTNIFFST